MAFCAGARCGRYAIKDQDWPDRWFLMIEVRCSFGDEYGPWLYSSNGFWVAVGCARGLLDGDLSVCVRL
jgi:hypothetical protein